MRRPLRPSVLATGAALLLAALLPAGASAQETKDGTETASLGQVTATITWKGADYGIKDGHLKIIRAGAVAFDQAIPDVLCDGCLTSVVSKEDVAVRDLDGDGEPEVTVDGYTGGAHCCVLLGIYDFRPATGTYAQLTRNFGSSGYGFKDLDGDGKVELDTDDVRFEDLFSSHAASFPPPRIFAYEHQAGVARLRDVTRRYPSVIRANAAEAKKLFKRFKAGDAFVDAGGVVSAYVADQYLLGRSKVGLKELDHQIARGILGTRKQGRAYRKRLLGFLHKFGYR
jgi:hypothetical protein